VPPAVQLHFTLTNSCCLNLVERWFAELTNRKLRRSAHRSVTELEVGVRKWINEWNKDPKPFVWVKTADGILHTTTTYCHRISDLGALGGQELSMWVTGAIAREALGFYWRA
jgi:hypothetical protein